MSKLLHTGIGCCPAERTRADFPHVWIMVWRYDLSLHKSAFHERQRFDRSSLRERSDAAMLAPLRESERSTELGAGSKRDDR